VRLLVLGGGPVGISAALHARELGAQVTLVEAQQVGGTSLNTGPAPVRTLARTARLMRDAKSWERLGLRGTGPQIDIPRWQVPGVSPTLCVISGDWPTRSLAKGSTSSTVVARRCFPTHTRSPSPTDASSGAMPLWSPSADAPAGCRSPAPSWR
jgi:2-polyprenyl-6-methoxyphenol hydroxylase-like FAD-dependent oxidoreductase